MADLSYRSSTQGNDASFGAASISATQPTGAAEDDLEIIWYVSAAIAPTAAPTHTTPSGWTLGGTTTYAGFGGVLNGRASLFYRIRGSTGGAVTLQSNINSAHVYYRLAYDNPDTSDPFDTVSFTTFTGTSAASPSITAANDNALLIGYWGGHAEGSTWTPPSGMTERIDFNAGLVADVIQATAGVTGAKTATISATSDGPTALAAFNSEVDAAFQAAWAKGSNVVLN